MITWLEWAIAVACLLLALLAAWYVIRNKLSDDLLLGGMVVLELILLAQLVTGLVALARTGRDVDGVTFVSYLVGSVVVLPLAVFWSLAERSRSGTAVLIVGVVVVAVMVLRLHAVWATGTAAP
jgi:ABC-type molybdate transport system permease subunit